MEEENEKQAAVSIPDDSILVEVKKLIGIMKEDTNFDIDIIIHINSAFATLHQLGVGPKEAYKITDVNNVWSEFIPDDDKRLDSVKTYVYLKVKNVFDPPLNGSLLESFNAYIRELEWRLNVASETVE